MPTYAVIDKSNNTEVYRYDSDHPIEWNYMTFDLFDHVVQPALPSNVVAHPGQPYEWLLDIGAFFDRFSDAKFAILTSADPIVKAIVQDVMVRKWVDLKRPDVAYGVQVIASKIPQLTYSMVTSILTTPARPDENLALRIMFFNGE